MIAEYPTENELEEIKNWRITDIHGLMEHIREYWEKWGAWKKEGDIYTLATGGWNGNEEIICAMQENIIWWAMYWYSSNRGGHYVFAPCTIENIKKLNG